MALPAPASAADGSLFHPYVTYDPGSSAANVAVGDLTGDGLDDVLVTTDYDSDYDSDAVHDWSLWVYPQQADGSLGEPTQLQTRGTYWSHMTVALADLDEDGDLDAAVTTKAGVEIFEQGPEGLAYTWTVPVAEGHDLELSDVSGDGLADLVVNGQNGIEVWWQVRGDFMRSPVGSKLTSLFATEIEVADVTGDGLADLVSAKDSTIDVRAQQADHSFAPPVSYASGAVDQWRSINGLAVGDTNGDGLADVHVSVGGNKPNAWVVTRFQLSDGTLAKPYVRESWDMPESLDATDVTGDGIADLVVLHGGWIRLGVFDSTPGTMLTETVFAIPYASHYNPKGLALGDVNSDGHVDALVADYNNGLVLLRGAAPGADVTAPDTSVTSGPSGTHRSRSATFGFGATEVSTFACSLDGAAWTPCTSPLTYDGLTGGSHTFRVRATDAAGNTDATPAQRSFVVDGPETTITSGPTGTIEATSATFGFSSTQATAYFECSLDGSAWQRCTSPMTYADLTTAKTHTFRVRGVDAEGLVDSTPAQRTFTVDAAADLVLSSLSATPDPVKRGSTLTYTARVTNAGPNAASDIVLTQGLPAGVQLESASAALDAPLSTTASCTGSDSTVRCSVSSLNPGDWLIVTVKVTVTATKGSLSSTAVVTTPTWDLDQGNDSASTYTRIGGAKGR